MLLRPVIVSLIAVLSGCQFYFGDDDDPPPCARHLGGDCGGSCEVLGQEACREADACRLVYVGDEFTACWSVAPPGPVEGAGCSGLGAPECSRRNDCVAHHAPGPGGFLWCGDEVAPPCVYPVERAAAPLRNPETGQCEPWGGSGPCAGDRVPMPVPDWAWCYVLCEGLDEAACLAADACRAIYAPGGSHDEFADCWGVAPSGPIQGGDCTTLDAYQCSRHNDCAAIHALVSERDAFWTGSFVGCRNEVACPPSTGLRNPQTGECQDQTCSPDSPGAGERFIPDQGACASYCTGLDEAACRAADGCRVIHTLCPPNADCTWEYAECWATAPSGPIRGGGCIGLDAQACSSHDDCMAEHQPSETCDDCPWQTPGLFSACRDEAPPPECATLASEAACIEASHCVPLYEGSGCTCDPMGCGCTEWTFVTCADQ